MYVEKTFKEDTAKKKKRRRLMILAMVIAIILITVAFIVISIIRANDRRLMSEIEKLDSEGIRYSNYGNYSMAYEQYEKANELTGKLKNNLQYVQAKKALVDSIAIRWHLFNSIIIGDDYYESGEYQQALKAYEGAQHAYFDVYETAEMQSESRIAQILDDKLDQVKNYIIIEILINVGELYIIEELYQNAFDIFIDAEVIARKINDLDLRRRLAALIFEANREIGIAIDVSVISRLQALMKKSEEDMEYGKALVFSDAIITIYTGLDIIDEQSQEDNKRIKNLIELSSQNTMYWENAAASESATKYSDALRWLYNVLGNLTEMGISPTHKLYKDTQLNIDRLEELARESEVEEEVDPEEVTNPEGGTISEDIDSDGAVG